MKSIRLFISIMLLFSFILLIAQSKSPTKVVGKIGDKTYTYEEYNNILENYYSFWQKKGEKLDNSKKQELNNKCWEELIARQLYDNEIKKRKIVVTDQQIYDYVLKNPPADVKAIKELQTNGKFDTQKLKTALDQNAEFRKNINEYLRNNMVYERLFVSIKNDVKVNTDSLKKEWLKKNSTVSSQVIWFNYNYIKKMDVSEEEISNYYLSNHEKFKKDPARKLKYVKLTNTPSFQDSLKIKTLVDSLYNDILSGKDFENLAKTFSEDPGSGAKGGDLGYFGKGRMIPEFEKACFETEPGQVAKPVLTRFGWHIIKVTDKRKNEQDQEEVKASHILIRVKPSDETNRIFEEQNIAITNELKTTPIEQIAINHHLQTMETDEFYQTEKFFPGIGSYPELVKFAFENKVGSVADAVTLRDGSKLIAVVSDSMGYHYSPLEKEKEMINRIIMTEKKTKEVVAFAKNFYSTYKPEEYLNQAKIDSLQIIEAKDIMIDSAIPSIGKAENLNAALFTTEKNKFTELVIGEKGAYLAYVTNKKISTEKNWIKVRSAEIDKVKSGNLNSWYFKNRQAITVEDKRKDFYKLDIPQPGKLKLN